MSVTGVAGRRIGLGADEGREECKNLPVARHPPSLPRPGFGELAWLATACFPGASVMGLGRPFKCDAGLVSPASPSAPTSRAQSPETVRQARELGGVLWPRSVDRNASEDYEGASVPRCGWVQRGGEAPHSALRGRRLRVAPVRPMPGCVRWCRNAPPRWRSGSSTTPYARRWRFRKASRWSFPAPRTNA